MFSSYKRLTKSKIKEKSEITLFKGLQYYKKKRKQLKNNKSAKWSN